MWSPFWANRPLFTRFGQIALLNFFPYMLVRPSLFKAWDWLRTSLGTDLISDLSSGQKSSMVTWPEKQCRKPQGLKQSANP